MARASAIAPAPVVVRHRPVWVRLVVLVLVPLLGLAGALAPQILRATRNAATARRLSEDIAELQSMIDLRAAVMTEQIDSESLTRVVQLGLSDAATLKLLGYDVRARHPKSIEATGVALRNLEQHGPSALASWVRSSLTAVRTLLAIGHATPDEIHERLMAVRRAVGSAVDQSVHHVVGTSGIGRMPALTQLELAVRFSRDGIERVNTFSNLLLGPATEQPERRAALIGATVIFQDSADELRASSEAWSERVADVLGNAAFVDLNLTVSELASSTRDVPITLGRMIELLAAGGSFAAQLEGLTAVAEREAQDWVDREADAAERQLVQLVALAGAVVAATAVFAVLSTRALSRRLGRLARRASDLSAGRLADDGDGTTDRRAPREIALVATALDDAVANLRHVERQAVALANGDLDDPALRRPAPGRLGDSIHASVTRLSLAWHEREELQARLAHQATHDPLTKLPNRAHVMESLAAAIAARHDEPRPLAVLFLDLDGFKETNDVHGHLVGDRLLQVVSGELDAIVRKGDVLARLGGDEFVVIADAVTTVDEATQLGERLVDAVRAVHEVDGHPVTLGASVGIAFADDPPADPNGLLGLADEAVYGAKRAGKGRVAVHVVA